MTADDALTRAWREVQDGLPEGSQADSPRCASTVLAAQDRSSDWVAVGPADEERMVRATDPVAALAGLVDATR